MAIRSAEEYRQEARRIGSLAADLSRSEEYRRTMRELAGQYEQLAEQADSDMPAPTCAPRAAARKLA
jgi:hypothetical protein